MLIAEREEELRQKVRNWKDAMEAKGLKVNVNKTKVMFSGKCGKSAVGYVKYPCGVCSKGVGDNSILCGTCGKWVHKRCSGITKRLTATDGEKFECRVCKGGVIKQDIADVKLTIDK